MKLTTDQVAEKLGIGADYVRRLAAQGKLQAEPRDIAKKGRNQFRFDSAIVNQYIRDGKPGLVIRKRPQPRQAALPLPGTTNGHHPHMIAQDYSARFAALEAKIDCVLNMLDQLQAAWK